MKRQPSMCQKLKGRELIFVLQYARVSSRRSTKRITTRSAVVVIAVVVAEFQKIWPLKAAEV
jgi:hypothetical protein